MNYPSTLCVTLPFKCIISGLIKSLLLLTERLLFMSVDFVSHPQLIAVTLLAHTVN